MNAWQFYKEMCASLRKDGLSTEGLYVAYLRGELRRARCRINELEGQENE